MSAITVLMPVYNAGAYLRQAIDSILNQTFSDFELLIINDGSTDNSEEIILSYKDKRIRYEKNENNLRLIASLNKGIGLANGKYIARMDADDISAPERLQLQFDFMEAHQEVALCGSWYEIIGDTTAVVRYLANHEDIMMKMLYQCHMCHPSVIMRKAAIETFDLKFDPAFLHAEDYDFFTRIGEKYLLANIQKVLLQYRVHAGSVSLQNRETQTHNSSVIKKRLFQKIGLAVTEEELELYRTLCQHEYSRGIAYLRQLQDLLERMVAANGQTGFFDRQFFQNYIAKLWFNVTYNVGTLNLYTSSSLHRYYPLSLADRIKFVLKSIGRTP